MARTVLVGAFVGLWLWQAWSPWLPPERLVPVVALALFGLLLLVPAADGAPDGFRPFPFAEGSYADGALAVASAPVWIHLAVLGRIRDLAWCVPVTLAAPPAWDLFGGGLPLWPAWTLWEVGFLLLGGAFRVHGMVYEARLRREREAVAEERRKIAREVHDLVGHGLGAALLNITAARMAAKRGDSDAVTAALEEAERIGRQSVRDVHRGLVLLRGPAPPDGTVEPAPPTVEDLPSLVDRWRATGPGVTLTVRGEPAGLDPAVGLAVYRIVQEALSNTARHAPGGDAAVTVDVGERVVRVTVADSGGRPARANPGGLGLVGMRERAAALGGTLDAGPGPDGWTVHATLPVTGGRP
ncbi:sensor histidine kinase [Actinocorallia populi]|uniref:sensor histidine kinase n=1 Tax=Actinocorallia populi TaxID=2079200 RepID=UPI0018E55534|nr:sensor histidine kinase [Actinocorallia populi]